MRLKTDALRSFALGSGAYRLVAKSDIRQLQVTPDGWGGIFPVLFGKRIPGQATPVNLIIGRRNAVFESKNAAQKSMISTCSNDLLISNY